MNPFELLGVGRDADEREIRRAYTARLRHTRPDDDPEGCRYVAIRPISSR
jgi:curved DNA-binding protein CbpA